MRVLSIILIVTLISCADHGIERLDSLVQRQQIQSLNGTWKVISFEDLSTQEILLQTQENSWGYDIVITFDDTKDPGKIFGKNTTNSVSGEFEYTSETTFKLNGLNSTKIGQPEWGNKFSAAIFNDNNAVDFEIDNSKLKIYYKNKSNSVTLVKQ